MTDKQIFTYQTRLRLTPEQDALLTSYAEIYGKAERTLFANLRAGKDLNALKREFLPKFGLTARQFNAVRIGLEGKIESISQRLPELLAEATAKALRADKVLQKLKGKKSNAFKLHQKKRRLFSLQTRTAKLAAECEAKSVRVCFGSNKLFNAQFHLADNGFDSHAEWKAAWRKARSSQFFVLGSRDETAGCQGCQLIPTGTGLFSLKLRLPNGLAPEKTLHVDTVEFKYGHQTITEALSKSKTISAQTKAGKPIVKRTGTAISYRFVRVEV